MAAQIELEPSRQLIARARRLSFALGLVLATTVGIRLSVEFRVVSDWTATGSNKLSVPSLELLHRISGPVTVIVSARERSFARTHATNLLTPYRDAKPDFDFRFIDPRRLPARAASLRLDNFNEARIQHGDRVERTAVLTEQGITNALYRMNQPDKRWIASLSGHGERSMLGRANHDLSLFGAELQTRGFSPRNVNLTQTGAVPSNSVLLVVASPSGELLEAEIALLEHYIAAGGNLLWISDPSDKPNPTASTLAALIDVERLPGTVVAEHSGGLNNLSPTISLLADYPAHPITDGLDVMTLYPTAGGLRSEKTASGFSAIPFLHSSEKSWMEIGPPQGPIAFDPRSESRGPFVLGLTLERPVANAAQTQRIVVLGDADFLSNRYLANQGNLQLGLRIFDWLTARGDAISIPAPVVTDGTLILHGRALQGLAFFAFLGLPAVLLSTGLTVRWRRRRR